MYPIVPPQCIKPFTLQNDQASAAVTGAAQAGTDVNEVCLVTGENHALITGIVWQLSRNAYFWTREHEIIGIVCRQDDQTLAVQHRRLSYRASSVGESPVLVKADFEVPIYLPPGVELLARWQYRWAASGSPGPAGSIGLLTEVQGWYSKDDLSSYGDQYKYGQAGTPLTLI
jgi:hypothetical protein